MSKLVYINHGGKEFWNVNRRNFLRRSTVFLPLAWFLGSRFEAKATSVIVNRTIAGGSQNAAQMTNDTFARPVTLPVGWSHIRVGTRCHMSNTGANLTGNPIFAFGFNSGTTNQYGDATTQNFGGIAFDTATWTWINSGTTQYQLPANRALARTRVGTTNTDLTLYGDGAQPLINAGAATNSADRGLIFIDVTHGSPNYTFHQPFRCVSGPGAGADVTAANFLLYMGQLAPTPPEGGYDTTNNASPTLAVNEGANGTWNAINFFWNRADAQMELCDIAVAVLA